MTGCLARTFGGEIPLVPGAVIKNTCLIVFQLLSCRVSASVQGQEWLSHTDTMHSRFDLLLHLRGYIHFSYLHTRSRLFG